MTEDEFYEKANRDQQEEKYREWCKENELDPEIEETRDQYKEWKAETGDQFWEGLDDDDRTGWEDNIIKSFD